MRKRTATLLIAALLLLGGGWWIGVATYVTAHRQAAPPTTGTPSGAPSTAADFVARIVALTNADRKANGCPALVTNALLMKTAQQHSEDMATHDFVGHNSYSGATVADRLHMAGYNYSAYAENIAWGQTTPDQVVNLWFNETPPNDAHRKNILNCALHEIGVGYVILANDPGKVTSHTYWTEDFGTRIGS